MTRHEFEALMDSEGWSLRRRALFAGLTPKADAATFLREMRRPDGFVEVERLVAKRTLLDWLRPFKTKVARCR